MTKMFKLAVAVSMLAFALLGFSLYQYARDYYNLLDWACEHGNGGYECGEM
jgi:hypothetical protein